MFRNLELVSLGNNTTAVIVNDVNALGRVLREVSISGRRVSLSSSNHLPTSANADVVIVPNFLERAVAVQQSALNDNKVNINVKGASSIEDAVSRLQHADPNIFLPLTGGLEKSVVGRLFDAEPSSVHNYFQRSTRSLRDRLRGASYIPVAPSSSQSILWNSDELDVEELFSQRNKIVTDITLEADRSGPQMRVYRCAFFYHQELFESSVMAFFSLRLAESLARQKLNKVDITVELFNQGFYVSSMLVVAITVCSTGERDPEELFHELFPGLVGEEIEVRKLENNKDILSMDAGVSASEEAELLKEFGAELRLWDFAAIIPWYNQIGRAAVAQENPNIRSHFRLLRNGNIYLYLAVCKDDRAEDQPLPTDFAALLSQLTAKLAPIKKSDFGVLSTSSLMHATATQTTPTVSSSILVEPLLQRLPVGGLAVQPRVAVGVIGDPAANVTPRRAPAALAALRSPSLRLGQGPVAASPQGACAREAPEPQAPTLGDIEILLPQNPMYNNKREQYAQEFHPVLPDSVFKPFFIAIPKSEHEIMSIVDYAAFNGKRVVVRSGGHQYCGYSSGNEEYVQILTEGMPKVLDFFSIPSDDLRLAGCTISYPDGDSQQHFATVSVCTKLEDLSKALERNCLTVPHGECPKVCIGGHVQTGGFGHQMRGLGLCLDFVYSFHIIIVGGNAETSRLVEVFRPELTGIARKDPLNDQIYKGVLGGSPGAFGVLSQVTFLCVSDESPLVADSRNQLGLYAYRGRDIGGIATKVVKAMLEFTEPSKLLLPGVDIFVTLSVRTALNYFALGGVMTELAYTGDHFSAEVEQQINRIVQAANNGSLLARLSNLVVGQSLRPNDPSKVAAMGVRKIGMVTAKGRELDLPFKKRVNITLGELSGPRADQFATKFGELVTEVVNTQHLQLVIQMMLGGCKAKDNDQNNRTGLPYRNQTFGFVFDLFYRGEEGKGEAVRIQDEMQALLDQTEGFDHRLLWGSFERESEMTDMNKPVVQNLYYGTAGVYNDLQAIKGIVDPRGIFTTEFTVQNPVSGAGGETPARPSALTPARPVRGAPMEVRKEGNEGF